MTAWGQAGWGQNWLKQVQKTTQEIARQAGESVEQARKRIEENQPQMELFMKQLGDNVQKSVHNIQKGLGGAAPDAPPTPEELSRLDFVYLTDRLVAMAYPIDKRGGRSASPSEPTVGNDLDVVAALLRDRHRGHYLIFNASEEAYDYSKFQDQVLEFKFAGHPVPPLGMLFKMCMGMESWLDADPENVAIIHCLTGKGRTATIAACFLAWTGEFSTPMEALEHVAERKRAQMERLTIPSQRRYLQYFSSVLDGQRLRSEPLLLRRVIMNTIPNFGSTKGTLLRPDQPPPGPGEAGSAAVGCCPYIQVFKAGKLISTTSYQPATSPRDARAPSAAEAAGSGEGVAAGDGAAASKDAGGGKGAAGAIGTGKPPAKALPWAYPSDESLAFAVDCIVQGDLLIRCRHVSPGGERASMFHAAIHTGYLSCGVLRLSKAQLDGACGDARFDEDFFLDLIFAPVERPQNTEKFGKSFVPASASGGATAAASAGAAGAWEEANAGAPAAAAAPAAAVAAAVEASGGGAEEIGKGAAAAAAAAATAAATATAAESKAVARREAGLAVEADAADAYDLMLHRDAGFWEEMGVRKERHRQHQLAREAAVAATASSGASPEQKAAAGALGAMAPAKERALRKQFSIFGGDGGDTGDGGEEEVAAGAQQRAAMRRGSGSREGGGGSSGGSSKVAKPLISDNDLLARLAAAEAEQDGFVNVSPPRRVTPRRGSGGAASATATPPPTPSDAAAVAAGTPGPVVASPLMPSGKAGIAAAAAAAPAAAATTVAGASQEMSALEQLEKELGIEDLAGMRAGGSGGSGVKDTGDDGNDAGDFDLDADLNELEGYLESLSAGNPAAT